MSRIHRKTRKNGLNDPDNQSEVVTHLELYILEFEVTCVLGSITVSKAGRSDRITVQLFQILKDDAVKVLNALTANWKTHQWPQNCKRSVFIPIPKKDSAKKCSNYHTAALISHASKVMFKILQGRLPQYISQELPDV